MTVKYNSWISPKLDEQLRKIKKRDFNLFNKVQKKIEQVLENPDHYKPMKNPLQGIRRVQIGSFILFYIIEGNTVRFLSVYHHDEAYKRAIDIS